MTARECILMVVTGLKGGGKSHQTLKELINYVVGNKTTGAYPRKVLIFDINDEYGDYRFNLYGDDPEISEMLRNPEIYKLMQGRQSIKIKAIAPEHILAYSAHPDIEIRRIRPFHTTDNIIPAKYNKKGQLAKPSIVMWRKGDPWSPEEAIQILNKVLQEFRGGRILIEDLSSVFGDQINRTVAGLITRNRHKDLDITLHVQSIAPILPRFWQNTNQTRYHKQMDPVEKSKTKLAGNYVLYKIVEKLVDEQADNGNKRYFVYIDNVEHKINGNYTREELTKAIQEYLTTNFNELKDLKNKRSLDGRHVYSYSDAVRIRTEHLINFYGNIAS